jgi:hypothetical protein
MSDREAGWLALASGVVLIVVAALADVLGYGSAEDRFGIGQIIVTVIGSALAGYGVWRLLQIRRNL